uniref:Uncharacterized protein n=1 Tax=Octactis speculum TaxID=3111310 RepID=A0A7S2GBP1_9STRA
MHADSLSSPPQINHHRYSPGYIGPIFAAGLSIGYFVGHKRSSVSGEAEELCAQTDGARLTAQTDGILLTNYLRNIVWQTVDWLYEEFPAWFKWKIFDWLFTLSLLFLLRKTKHGSRFLHRVFEFLNEN